MWKERSYSYVYKTTNTLNNEYYVGMRSCDCEPSEDDYLGSGRRIIRSIKKYGRNNFSKEIIKICRNRKEASDLETFIVNEDLLNDPLCLNLKTGGEYITDYKFKEGIGDKISNSVRLYYSDPKNREKQSIVLKESFKTHPEYCKRASEIRREVLLRPDHFEKTSKSRKLLWKDPDYKNKMIDVFSTAEFKTKKGNSIKSYLATDKGKENISKATKGYIHINDGEKTKRIPPSKLSEYLNKGWVEGSLIRFDDEYKRKISKSSKNRTWVSNVELQKNKRIKNDQLDDFLRDNIGWNIGIKLWNNESYIQEMNSEKDV